MQRGIGGRKNMVSKVQVDWKAKSIKIIGEKVKGRKKAYVSHGSLITCKYDF